MRLAGDKRVDERAAMTRTAAADGMTFLDEVLA
jgi:hypothetical protein